MTNAFHELLLSRLDVIAEPTVRLRELLPDREASWRPLIANGILVEADMPDEIEIAPSRCLNVRKIGSAFFGFDTAEDYPTPQPLSREDITEYRVAVPALLGHLRRLNAIDGRNSAASSDPTGVHFLGRKSMASGTVNVWLGLALGSSDTVAGRLSLLATEDAHSRHVVVFPLWPTFPPTISTALTTAGVLLADLDPESLTIRWPAALKSETVSSAPDYGLIHDGASWRIHFLGDTFTIPHRKGVIHLARLLSDPINTWTPRELEQGFRLKTSTNDTDHEDDGLVISDAMESALHSGEESDIARIRVSAAALKSQIADAHRRGDVMAEQEAEKELADLKDRTTKLVGRGNRSRVTGADEKARKNVSNHITLALAAIEKVRMSVGQHLRKYITLGSSMTYSPPRGEVWQVVFPKK